MNKVLITGGSGFIGASLVKKLGELGIRVRIFDRSNDRATVAAVAGEMAELDWVQGDIRDADAVSAAVAGCDGIVHLAGLLTPQCRDNPVLGAEVNLIGGLHVFQAAHQHGIKQVVYASSAGVFGTADAEHPAPLNHYGAFKLALEGSARAFWQDLGIASVGLRPFVVYGPGRETGVSAGPSLACRAIAAGEPYQIGFSGACGLVYVDDVVDVFWRALSQPVQGAHVLNVTGEVWDMADLAAQLMQLYPQARISVGGQPLDIIAGVSDAALQALMPERVQTPLAQGLQQTVAHYQRCLRTV